MFTAPFCKLAVNRIAPWSCITILVAEAPKSMISKPCLFRSCLEICARIIAWLSSSNAATSNLKGFIASYSESMTFFWAAPTCTSRLPLADTCPPTSKGCQSIYTFSNPNGMCCATSHWIASLISSSLIMAGISTTRKKDCVSGIDTIIASEIFSGNRHSCNTALKYCCITSGRTTTPFSTTCPGSCFTQYEISDGFFPFESWAILMEKSDISMPIIFLV